MPRKVSYWDTQCSGCGQMPHFGTCVPKDREKYLKSLAPNNPRKVTPKSRVAKRRARGMSAKKVAEFRRWLDSYWDNSVIPEMRATIRHTREEFNRLTK